MSNFTYRKKPVTIQAVQITEGWDTQDKPSWLIEAFQSGLVRWNKVGGAIVENSLRINTMEGAMHAHLGDWIIRGVEGELYACNPLIFTKTYEKVNTEEPTSDAKSN